MLKNILLTIAALALVAGCKSKPKATEQTAPAATGGGDAVESAPMDFNAQGSDSGKIDGLNTIYFDYDKANINAESKQTLKGNVAWLKAHPKAKMQIEGHCDKRGTIEYNVALGERRANAVKAYMVSLGAKADRLSIISYGEEKPIAMGDSDADMGRNRRANFVPVQ